ncbi:molybdenum cofactor guanylyltransferase [Wenzhouxiangella sp. AB-CW3]|uniref:molybdenum cofactor guanylyltransferase n=1 Tax=Wenzhouxiangella sp. AB-CW3 TaxID=2771012 RepID=UPI001CC2ABAD|nr:molybdenum cofactor guanylyltransferase [Wenzhouxiangella sp. AB-CW3]
MLAGGRSSRMGRDKAGLVWGNGQTFLDRSIALLGEAGCARVIVSGNRPCYDHVPDLQPHLGPMGGIASILVRRPELGGTLLIVPVDMPHLVSDDLTPLVSAAASHDGSRFTTTPLPMALSANPRIRRIIVALLNQQDLALRNLANHLDLASVEPTSDRLSGNINSPDDYRLASDNP